MSTDILVAIKKCFISVIIQLSPNIIIQTNYLFEKMKDETGGIFIEEFVGRKP